MRVYRSLGRLLDQEFDDWAARHRDSKRKRFSTRAEMQDRIEELEDLLGLHLPLVDLNRKRLGVTPKESQILSLLLAANGKVCPREFMYRAMYGDRIDVDQPLAQTLNVTVLHLRKKLKHLGVRVLCEFGVGYYINTDDCGKLLEMIARVGKSADA
jgi:DNA-binding response OmpR family regulator